MTDLELVEPTFVLRASDPLAPGLLRQWARRQELAWQKGRISDADAPDKIARARQLATDMEIWLSHDSVRRQREAIAKLGARMERRRRGAEVIKLNSYRTPK